MLAKSNNVKQELETRLLQPDRSPSVRRSSHIHNCYSREHRGKHRKKELESAKGRDFADDRESALSSTKTGSDKILANCKTTRFAPKIRTMAVRVDC